MAGFLRAAFSVALVLLVSAALPGAEGFANPPPLGASRGSAKIGSRARLASGQGLLARRASPPRRGMGLRMQFWDDDIPEDVPGKWSLDAELDDVDFSLLLTLNGDRTISVHPDCDLKGQRFPNRAMWKCKGESFSLEFDRNPASVSIYYDLTFFGKIDHEASTVKGTVMEGEYDPEYCGKFTMKQLSESGEAVVDNKAAAPPPPAGGPPDEWDGEVNEEAWFDG